MLRVENVATHTCAHGYVAIRHHLGVYMYRIWYDMKRARLRGSIMHALAGSMVPCQQEVQTSHSTHDLPAKARHQCWFRE